MDEVARSAQIIRFGVFEVDLQTGELRKNGAKVPLQGQPFQVCAILLEQSGALVTREELRQKDWPADNFVDFDHALNTAITKIRLALGDDADNPRFVETLPRRGYRFIAPVDKPSPQAVRHPRLLKYAIVAVAVLLLTGGGVFLWQKRAQANPLTDKDVLVLADFVNTTGDPVFDGTLRQG